MRYEKLDIIRGFAISMMIVFHTNYLLLNMFSIDYLNFSNLFWKVFGLAGGYMFIIISAISFMLSEQKHKDKINKRYLKYSFFLGIIALFITIFTYIFLKSELIIFGILHFFSASFLLMLLLRKLGYINFIIGIIIIIIPMIIDIKTKTNYISFLGFHNNKFYSADYWPLIPYFGVFLLSYSISLYLYNKQLLHKILIGEKNSFIYNLLKVAGKHSLLIYLIHVPIIILLIYLIKYLWNI